MAAIPAVEPSGYRGIDIDEANLSQLPADGEADLPVPGLDSDADDPDLPSGPLETVVVPDLLAGEMAWTFCQPALDAIFPQDPDIRVQPHPATVVMGLSDSLSSWGWLPRPRSVSYGATM